MSTLVVKGELRPRGARSLTATIPIVLLAAACEQGAADPEPHPDVDRAALLVAPVTNPLGQVALAQPVSDVEHPDFAAKLRDRDGYRVARTREALEDTCPGTGELQHVRDYDGTLGQPRAFVAAHDGPVGALEVRADDAENVKYCSGTLIARNLFLTASHCVDALTEEDAVAFDYEQLAGSTALAEQSHFLVERIVEDGADHDLDYAILELEGWPGDTFGWTELEPFVPALGHVLTIIQHPHGDPKQVEVGTLHSFGSNSLRYDDLDTQPGSSGSGILDVEGRLIGVHTQGGCANGGENKGTRMDRIVDVSETVQSLVPPTTQARVGRVTLLRVHDVGTAYGPPGDSIDAEAIVKLDDGSRHVFGFELRPNGSEDTNLGMLRLLRDALKRDVPIRLEVERQTYSTSRVLRVMRQ